MEWRNGKNARKGGLRRYEHDGVLDRGRRLINSGTVWTEEGGGVRLVCVIEYTLRVLTRSEEGDDEEVRNGDKAGVGVERIVP